MSLFMRNHIVQLQVVLVIVLYETKFRIITIGKWVFGFLISNSPIRRNLIWKKPYCCSPII